MKKKEKQISISIIDFLKKENFLNQKELKILLIFLKEKRILKKSLSIKEKDILNFLIKNKIIIERSNYYSLESLEGLFAWIQKKSYEKALLAENNTKKFLDHLKSFFNITPGLKVKLYEGIDGIKQSYQHILDHAKDEICAYYSVIETQQTELQRFFQQEYVQERAKRKIFARNITVKTPKAIFYKLKSKEIYMEMKIAPPEIFPFLNGEINLYENFMHCMTFDQYGGNAVIIEGENIVKLQKALFEITWNSIDKISSFFKSKINYIDKKNLEKNHLYITDNIKEVIQKINIRKNKFKYNLEKDWLNANPVYIKTKDGENILKICDLEVMSDFQKPYMKELAKIATTNGGKILNIGFGLGIADNFIEERRKTRKISEHHIIEMNNIVFKKAKEWREKQKEKNNIFIHKGKWEDVFLKFSKDEIIFDGVLYDGYPLSISEICRDSVRFLYSLFNLKLVKEKKGIVTFFMDSTDGFGESFMQYIKSLGVNKTKINKVNVKLPNRRHDYWNVPYFLAPTLANIIYPK